MPANETLEGNPRWKWLMIRMILALYRTAGTVTAPNGCPPKWVHLVSEADAPVHNCSLVHRRLGQRPSYSHVGFMIDPQDRGPWGKEVPIELRPAAHTSQWTTLAISHAIALGAAEDELYEKWRALP